MSRHIISREKLLPFAPTRYGRRWCLSARVGRETFYPPGAGLFDRAGDARAWLRRWREGRA